MSSFIFPSFLCTFNLVIISHLKSIERSLWVSLTWLDNKYPKLRLHAWLFSYYECIISFVRQIIEFRQVSWPINSGSWKTMVFIGLGQRTKKNLQDFFADTTTIMTENYISYVMLLKHTSHIDSSPLRTVIFKTGGCIMWLSTRGNWKICHGDRCSKAGILWIKQTFQLEQFWASHCFSGEKW